MNLVLCGILTSLAIGYCVIFNETAMFNMMMCVFCVLAIISVWSQNNVSDKDREIIKQETDKKEK